MKKTYHAPEIKICFNCAICDNVVMQQSQNSTLKNTSPIESSGKGGKA